MRGKFYEIRILNAHGYEDVHKFSSIYDAYSFASKRFNIFSRCTLYYNDHGNCFYKANLWDFFPESNLIVKE